MKNHFTKFPLKLLKMAGLHPKNSNTTIDKFKVLVTFLTVFILNILAIVGIFKEKDIEMTAKLMESAMGYTQV